MQAELSSKDAQIKQQLDKKEQELNEILMNRQEAEISTGLGTWTEPAKERGSIINVQELAEEVSKLQTQLDSAKGREDTLQIKNDQLRSFKSMQDKEIEQLKGQLQKLQTELSDRMQRINALGQQKEALEEKIQVLEGELAENGKQRDTALISSNSSEAEQAKLHMLLTAKTKEANKAKYDAKNSEKLRESLAKDLMQSGQRERDLKKQLQEAFVEIEAKATAASDAKLEAGSEKQVVLELRKRFEEQQLHNKMILQAGTKANGENIALKAQVDEAQARIEEEARKTEQARFDADAASEARDNIAKKMAKFSNKLEAYGECPTSPTGREGARGMAEAGLFAMQDEMDGYLQLQQDYRKEKELSRQAEKELQTLRTSEKWREGALHTQISSAREELSSLKQKSLAEKKALEQQLGRGDAAVDRAKREAEFHRTEYELIEARSKGMIDQSKHGQVCQSLVQAEKQLRELIETQQEKAKAEVLASAAFEKASEDLALAKHELREKTVMNEMYEKLMASMKSPKASDPLAQLRPRPPKETGSKSKSEPRRKSARERGAFELTETDGDDDAMRAIILRKRNSMLCPDTPRTGERQRRATSAHGRFPPLAQAAPQVMSAREHYIAVNCGSSGEVKRRKFMQAKHASEQEIMHTKLYEMQKVLSKHLAGPRQIGAALPPILHDRIHTPAGPSTPARAHDDRVLLLRRRPQPAKLGMSWIKMARF